MVAFEGDLGAAALTREEGSWFARVRRALSRDLAFYAVIAVYFAGAEVVSLALGWRYLHPMVASYLGVAAAFTLAAVCAMATGHFFHRSVRNVPAPHLRALHVVRATLAPERFAGLLLFSALAAFMGAFTSVKTMLPLVAPFWSDTALSNLDRLIFLGQDPWRLLHPILGNHHITRAIEFLYGPAWMLLMVGAPFFVCVHLKNEDLRRRFLAAYLLAWIVNGTIAACLTMSAGPAFYGAVTGDPHRFGGLVSYLQFDRMNPLSAAWGQQLLWTNYQRHGSYFGAGISAFPSLHVTMAVLFALFGWNLHRRLGYGLMAFAGTILLGSIHLGWHYAVDGAFAIASTCGMWKLSGVRRTGRAPADVSAQSTVA